MIFNYHYIFYNFKIKNVWCKKKKKSEDWPTIEKNKKKDLENSIPESSQGFFLLIGISNKHTSIYATAIKSTMVAFTNRA